MAHTSPVRESRASLTLAKVPSPIVFPSSYGPTRVFLAAGIPVDGGGSIREEKLKAGARRAEAPCGLASSTAWVREQESAACGCGGSVVGLCLYAAGALVGPSAGPLGKRVGGDGPRRGSRSRFFCAGQDGILRGQGHGSRA
jgi:hypothetical protein